MGETGKLVISLDFELLWGVFDKVDLESKAVYFQNTREVIPRVLKLFSDYGISCTWAAVGMLFNDDWDAWERNFPPELPDYQDQLLSPYRFGQRIKASSTEILCFAPELIGKIKNTHGQEVATHTYSHYYCSEKGQTARTFKADLENAVRMARSKECELRSLVFPRNQLNEEYLEVCHQMGIQTVRSNPTNWYWKETENSSFLKRIFRTGDAYIGFNDKSYPIQELTKKPDRPLEQKASRLLRPYSGNRILNLLKMNRIKSEMKTAAKKKEIYHLWWHPHNFGSHPEENLSDLERILQFYQVLEREHDFKSCSMSDIYDQVIQDQLINTKR